MQISKICYAMLCYSEFATVTCCYRAGGYIPVIPISVHPMKDLTFVSGNLGLHMGWRIGVHLNKHALGAQSHRKASQVNTYDASEISPLQLLFV